MELRRTNLGLLVDRYGLSTVAKHVKKPPSQVNDMLAGRKSFGEKVARAMESHWPKDLGRIDFDALNGTVNAVQTPNTANAQMSVGAIFEAHSTQTSTATATLGPFIGLSKQVSDLKAIGEIPPEAAEMLEGAIKGAARLTAAMRAELASVHRLSEESAGGNLPSGQEGESKQDRAGRNRAGVQAALNPEGDQQDDSGTGTHGGRGN